MAKRQKSTASLLKAFIESDIRFQGVKQAFIVSALGTYASKILTDELFNPMPGMVTDELWKDIAKQLKTELTHNY